MLKHKIMACLLLAGISAVTAARAGDNAWLVGVWQLNNSDKTEYLEFTADSVMLVSDHGDKISGDYELTDSAVKIVYKFKGKKIPVELNYAAGKNMLKGNLATTGKSVQYTKSG